MKSYNGPPIVLDNEGARIYEKYCSFELNKNHTSGQSISTCCATDQLKDFEDQAQQLDGLVTSCEICKLNIYRLTCSLICDPNQSEFVYSDNVTNGSVNALNFAISLNAIESVFNSCKDVLMPGSNAKVILMMCLEKFGKCSPQNFLRSLMDYSPLKITPIILNSTDTPPYNLSRILNFSAPKCNESIQIFNRVIKKCACQDCLSGCPIPVFPEPEVKKIFNLTVYQFVITVIYSMIFTILTIFYIVKTYRNRYHSILYDSDPVPEINDQFGLQQIINEDPEVISYESNAYEFQIKFYKCIQSIFRRWGILISTHKFLTTFFALILITSLSAGLTFHLKIVSDPIKMWSPPDDIFHEQKAFFDVNMGPSYRIEQIVITTPKLKPSKINIMGVNYVFGPPLKPEIISEIFKIQDFIANLSIAYNKTNSTVENLTVKDLCVKPTSPYSENCLMLSITQYFQNNISTFFLGNQTMIDWHTHLDRCTYNPTKIVDNEFYDKSCLGDFAGTIDPKLVLGGFDTNPIEATALIITYLMDSHLNEDKNLPVILWEKELIKFLENYKHPDIKLTFRTERSLQDEIDRQSHTETLYVLLSYLMMFVYVCFSLGKFTTSSFKAFFINQKIVLGFAGVFIVFLSVLSSIGLFCYMKYDVNIIVLQVLPFLALAVGVDNIFLLVHEYRLFSIFNPVDTPVPSIVGEVLGSVGPGMLVSCVAQIIAFSIGAISNIPAVKCFSLFAAVTIAINFTLQMTLFIVAFALDIKREKNKILDVLFCLSDPEYIDNNTMCCIDYIFQFLSKIVFSSYVRPIILISFITVWFLSIVVIPYTPMKLEPTETLPQDSYLIPYFKDVFSQLKSGPMLYFVVKPGYHYENITELNMLCSATNCSHNSLTNILNEFSSVPESSRIATKTYSWIDAYIAWLTPNEKFLCCAFSNDTNKNFIPSYKRDDKSKFIPCFNTSVKPFSLDSEIFSEYLPWFLSDIPNVKCPYGGKPLYGRNVILNDEFYSGRNRSASPVYTSSFITFHTSLVKSDDFKTALIRALYVAEDITKEIGHEVYPYSDFYIFYGYYLKLWKEASISFGLAFVGVFTVHIFLYAFNIRMVIIMTFLTFLMSAVNFGFMNLFHIYLNPVSLVNLIMVRNFL